MGLLTVEGAPAPDAIIRANWTWDMYVRYNVAIAAAYVTLAAAAEGLGTCWVNNYDEQGARAALNIPPTHSLVCLMTLGYAAETPDAKPRHPLPLLRVDEGFPDG
jgi:nitroreductase